MMSAGTNIDWLLHIYFARKDFERCKKLIDRELYRHLNPEYLYFVKGLIDREEGNNIEALRNLQKSLKLNSQNIEIYKEIGKTLFMMGRYNQSLSIFREAEELSTRLDHEIFHFIGELLLRSAAARNQYELAHQEELEAKTYFQKAVQTGKKLESFQRLAEIHRKEKEYNKAIEVLENCLLLSPENTDVLTEIGVLYLKLNETQKAFDRLLEVIQFDKNCLRGLMAFGAILQSRNDVDGALGKYREIAALKPDIAELWNNIGLCFFKKQKFIVAISSLRKAIWLSPLNYNALYNLSLIYITAQQYASAFHTLAAAINLRKDNAECYMLLGICLRKLEDFDNAFTAFERASAISAAAFATSTTSSSSAATATASKSATNNQNANSKSTTGGSTSNTSHNPLIHLNFALFCYETGRLAMATEQYNRFVGCAQDLMLLPTEYKFQATKLKSLLKISSSHILSCGDTANTSATAVLASDVIDIETADLATTTTTTTTTAAKAADDDDASVSNIYNYVNVIERRNNIPDDFAEEDEKGNVKEQRQQRLNNDNSYNDKYNVNADNDKDKDNNDFARVSEDNDTMFVKQKSKIPLEVNAVVN
ncbi:putative Bardet-Biedl syndrome 4 protein [Lucilia cuprina]|uniref:Putative Bardet-Biedl syndrome 4 protein n=1 Tax=Lucilia cuprina TaxID=7375 RepID=A0A0L0BP76_LUCCU|nr:putative Bardet-Biedl syndrome 4 protein [Lucilia cuprina]